MISKPLLKKTLKENWKFWTIITVVICLFLFILIIIVVPTSAQGRIDAAEGSVVTAVIGILEQVYEMFIPVMMIMYIAFTANKLIASQVDKQSMSFAMVHPIKRNQVSATQGLFLVVSIVASYLALTLFGLLALAISGIAISPGSFILVNLGQMLLMLAISGIAFIATCFFNYSSKCLALGVGLPIAFFLCGFISKLEGYASIMGAFKYFTIFSLFNFSDIMAGNLNMIWQFGLLLGIAVVCYIFGGTIFKRKDLPL